MTRFANNEHILKFLFLIIASAILLTLQTSCTDELGDPNSIPTDDCANCIVDTDTANAAPVAEDTAAVTDEDGVAQIAGAAGQDTKKRSEMKNNALIPVVTAVAVLMATGCANLPKEAKAETSCIPYDRKDYKHWIDADGDCQNTRAEVLIEENTGTLTYKTSQRCTVAKGTWLGSFTGTTFTTASSLDVDHMVPLKEAHDSGAYGWTEARREEYANDLSDSAHLIAVSASANRSKGARVSPVGSKPAGGGQTQPVL